MSQRSLVIYCGLLMSLSAFSIDITLPFFTRISGSLSVSLTWLPLTVTVFLFCMGLMQLVFGPSSDRYGRKPALLAGLIIFLMGSVLAGLAPSFNLLVCGRALQGVGASASFVISRSILRDLFTGAELARQLSLATAIFSVGPIVAPLFGALLIVLGAEWRWVFAVMFVYASVLLTLLLLYFPETNQHRDPEALQRVKLLRNLKTVLRHPQSRWFMVVNAVTQTSMILIIATLAPLYEIEFGVSGILFGFYFALHAVGIVLGQMLNRRLIARLGPLRSAMVASLFMITAGALIFLTALSGIASALILTGLIPLFAFGYLSVGANTTAIALMPHARISGFTASLLGAFSMMVSTSLGMLVGSFVQTNASYWGVTITLISLVSLSLMFVWYRNHGLALDTGENTDLSTSGT